MDEQIPAADAAASTDDYQESDVFLWANNLVSIKEELKIDLFLFNKNYTVYRTSRTKDLEMQMHQILLDPLLDFVLDGAGKGMIVRGFEDAEAEQNVLQRTRVKNVENARTTLNWLRTQEQEIEVFVEEEHDFKRIKGVLARFSHADLKEPFYVVKALPQANIMKGAAGWLMRGGKFVKFDAEGALRIPPDNQLLILEQDLYVFNQSKLASLFGYDAKKYGIAQIKMEEIGRNFKLSFTENMTLEEMVKGKRALVNKLQNLNTEGLKQDELIAHAEDLDIGLMVDDNGAIIIMDEKDLTRFINLLNDDYVESSLTGNRYEIKSKRPLKPPEEDELLKQL
jgi:hypothetical protein